jgi:hypothetical protein
MDHDASPLRRMIGPITSGPPGKDPEKAGFAFYRKGNRTAKEERTEKGEGERNG